MTGKSKQDAVVATQQRAALRAERSSSSGAFMNQFDKCTRALRMGKGGDILDRQRWATSDPLTEAAEIEALAAERAIENWDQIDVITARGSRWRRA